MTLRGEGRDFLMNWSKGGKTWGDGKDGAGGDDDTFWWAPGQFIMDADESIWIASGHMRSRPVAEALIGEQDGVAVSFALFFYNFSTFLGKPGIYLEDLYVQPEHRGKGFGSKMLAHIAALAKERNCGRFEWSVLNWNSAAIRTYEKLDATPMKEWILYRLSGEALDRLADKTG